MPQLVGVNCAVCRSKITNELDARFCPECGHPRHDACARPPEQPAGALCRGCGVVVDPWADPSRPKVPPRPERPPHPPGPFPVAKVCPKCQSEKCKLVRPKGLVAFKWDRVCKGCSTRYTPPTPLWAGAVFIGAGLILAGVGGFGVLIDLINLMRGNVLGVPSMACEGFVGVVGCLAVVHGFRVLSSPGRV